MENIKISKVCGLCAGCTFAINTTKNELNKRKPVTIFKEIVHNKNVNYLLHTLGAKCEDDISKLNSSETIIIRAHGEPPSTYAYLNSIGANYVDCTCPNVKAIHNLVKKHYDNGYKIILLGKFHTTMHPEVLSTNGWANNDAILIENEHDLKKLDNQSNNKFYLVCQTTFNISLADELINKIKTILEPHNELIINKSICLAQKTINEYSVKLAHDSDIMIVVGGKNSSNTKELYNNLIQYKPTILIENITEYKDALKDIGIKLSPSTKVGITAGASTMREELESLKTLIEYDLNKKE